MSGEDFEIKGKVNIDYSALDDMSNKAQRAAKTLEEIDKALSSGITSTALTDVIRSLNEIGGLHPFANTSQEFLSAVTAAHKLNNELESLDGTQRALLDSARQVASELGSKNYENLSSRIDRFNSSDTRSTYQMASGGVGVNLSDREQRLAIVASMTAKAAAEDRKFAEEEQKLSDKIKFVTSEFDRSTKERQKFMETSYRNQVVSAFPPIFTEELSAETVAINKVLSKAFGDTFVGADEQALKLVNHLPRVRYALYDVAASATAAGLALTAAAVAPLALGINANRAFADVVRTAKLGETGTEDYSNRVNNLRKQFVELQQTIPESFTELTKIGALGGQLNIATESLASFTKTVAMFSATTNVNIQDAATAFGRLDQLINGVNGRYEQLGSSILAVGVNSVATESQIIAIAQQIASIANLAKFSADQVIGLSGALASVGTSPELSRGLVTRLFGNIQTAVSTGSEALKKFGAVSNQSAADFKNGWETGAAAQFIRFLKGLNEDGTNAETTLRGLGIASIRDIPTLLKLAQNWRDVAESLRIANTGFVDNVELQKQYGTIANTVSDRLKVLTNNFEALLSTIAQGTTESGSALSTLIGTLSEFLQFLTKIASNPISQVLASILIGANLLIGALTLLGGGVAFLGARLTAIIQTVYDAALAQGVFTEAMKVSDMSIRQVGKSMVAAASASKLFRSAFMTTIIGAGITVALTALTSAFTLMGDMMKSSGEKARQYFNDIDVSQAIKADTEALKNGVAAYDSWTISQQDSSNSISARKSALIGMTEAEKALQDELSKTTSYVNEQTIALGQNYAQVLAQTFGDKVVSEKDNPLRALFDDPQLMDAFKQTGLTALDVITTTVQDGVPAAKAKIDAAMAQIKVAVPESKGITAEDQYSQITKQSEAVDGATAALYKLSEQTSLLSEEQKANIAYEEALGIAIEQTKSEAEIATDKLKEYKDAVESAFIDTNVVSDFAASFEKLAEGIGQSGNDFSSWSAAGRQNLANFQDAIATSLRAGSAMGLNATQSVAMLFAALQAQGIDTANLLAQVANIPGVNVSQIQGIIDSGMFAETSAGFDAIASSAKNAGSSVGGAAEKIRTLIDYANDLEEVYSRAFDIRFSSMQTLDEITSSFRKLQETTDNAKKDIQDLNSEISKLTADKSLKEYFLRVAEAYGDTLRAAQLRSEIADIDSTLVGKSKDLAKAQDKTNKTLIGNSDAAIQNRSDVLGLVKSYQDHIKTLASSGMSQEQLAIATEQLRQDFMNQATQLGYNSSELGVYAAAFNDVSVAIANVPRDVTVDANTDPAMQALNEYEAKLKQIGSTNYGGGTVLAPNFGNIARIRELEGLVARYSSYASEMAEQRSFAASDQALNVVRVYMEELARLRGYSVGGYTGAGGKYQPAGIVHKGEYVIPKEQVNQQTGLPYYMSQPRSFASGGFVGAPQAQMVYLSPEDRAILRSVGGSGEVVLYANNEAIARSANAGNRQIVATGGRP